MSPICTQNIILQQIVHTQFQTIFYVVACTTPTLKERKKWYGLCASAIS